MDIPEHVGACVYDTFMCVIFISHPKLEKISHPSIENPQFSLIIMDFVNASRQPDHMRTSHGTHSHTKQRACPFLAMPTWNT